MTDIDPYIKQIDRHEEELMRLNQAINQLTINISIFTEKQTFFINKLDDYLSTSHKKMEERISNLENLRNVGRWIPVWAITIIIAIAFGHAVDITKIIQTLSGIIGR